MHRIIDRPPRDARMRLARSVVLALVAQGALAGAAGAADYRYLPGGPFTSVLPQGATPAASTVTIAPFELRARPVTNAEFRDFVVAHPPWQRGNAPALFADARYLVDWAGPAAIAADASRDAAPVVNVSWFAAQAYCESEGARLPTWLEWEFAAAADETRTDARADPAWRRRILAWYERPAARALPAVGGPPNAWGVSDLHGLAWEWVDDFNALFIAGDSRTQGDPDLLKFCGAGAISIVDRDSYAVLMRIALLSSLSASDTTGTLGFRCARTPAEPRP
jgi:formylglycine-generating enzyme required for sulfatase activity